MRKKKIITFTIIAFALSTAVAVAFSMLHATVHSWAGLLTLVLCLISPFMATILTGLVFKEKPLSGLGFSFRFSHWHFIAWLLMPILVVAVLALSCNLPGMNFLSQDLVDEYIDYPDQYNYDTATSSSVSQMVSIIDRVPIFDATGILLAIVVAAFLIGGTVGGIVALGSEAGWRGYMLKQLEGLPFIEACLVSGIAWGVSLAPLVSVGFFFDQHHVLGIPMIILFCTLLTPAMVYVRMKSATLWSPATMIATLLLCTPVFHMYVIGYNELYTGLTGLAGMSVVLLLDIFLFFCDGHITREQIMTSPLRLTVMPTRQQEREEVMQDRPNQEHL